MKITIEAPAGKGKTALAMHIAESLKSFGITCKISDEKDTNAETYSDRLISIGAHQPTFEIVTKQTNENTTIEQ